MLLNKKTWQNRVKQITPRPHPSIPLSSPNKEADWLFVFGASTPFFAEAADWLNEDKKRRLIFIELALEPLAALEETLFDHPQVQIHFVPTAPEISELAEKMGWKCVFLTMAVIDLAGFGSLVQQFENMLRDFHAAAHLLVSDWADRGETVIKNAVTHSKTQKNVRPALQLKDKFRGIPAIICGAGPSLEKNRTGIDPDKALIFAGGAALNRLTIEPHFSASIDRQAPYAAFKQNPFSQAPFFYQSRMNPQNFSLIHGEKLYVPDSSYPAEAWLGGGEELFQGGWTVGTFLAALALHLGCNPIIFVGMDLCYDGKRKYAFSSSSSEEPLVETLNSQGETVWTQRDWIMAASWISELAEQNRDRNFFNISEKGLSFGPFVTQTRWEELSFPQAIDLSGRVHAELMTLRSTLAPQKRLTEWESSVKRCLQLSQQKGGRLEKEIVYQKFLFPLWQIWKPIFERELEIDPQPISLEEKMRINQLLFFQQVLYEQTN